jgi:hypothetical protein
MIQLIVAGSDFSLCEECDGDLGAILGQPSTESRLSKDV